ncbi:MAG: hypothetical protein IPM45_18320 [Acidimicrobiales bacterium]|nr:hypothetical protein [Acidimicrobiales bacterium]
MRAVAKAPCLLCRAKPASRPRGLCWVCYYRRRAETTVLDSPHARRGVGLGGGRRPAAEPTAHPPGSAGKVEVMAERAARGEGIFHPDDAGWATTTEG